MFLINTEYLRKVISCWSSVLRRHKQAYWTWFIPRLLMTWICKEPGHQQAWYWLSLNVVHVFCCLNEKIEAGTKWPPFCRWHFKWFFFSENVLNLDEISLKFAPKVLIDNISSLGQVMAWNCFVDKPLSGPMMAQLSDAYMRHLTSIS